jgi:bifunctional non-homologous end joining protein LigD
MVERLDRYRSMRDFSATPEPSGGARGDDDQALTFVVQEHHARRLHWDFRLERDGVLVSWAVPKGLPPDPKVNHLAVHTEDHPLDYGGFEGEIPAGNYGAGKVVIWDHGTYDTHKWDDREVMVTLHGDRVVGRYVLFRTRGDDWMIHRMDPPQDPHFEPMPEGLRPMTAAPGELPDDDAEWAFEIRWSGERVLIPVDGGRSQLLVGGTDDVSALFPELRPLGNELGSRAVLLDAVLTSPDGPTRLAKRLEPASDSAVRRRARESPAALVLVDLLYEEGHVVLDEPYEKRRARLEGLRLSGPAWKVPSAHVGNGAALLGAARAQGVSGLVAKRLSSPYRPGERSQDWTDIRA